MSPTPFALAAVFFIDSSALSPLSEKTLPPANQALSDPRWVLAIFSSTSVVKVPRAVTKTGSILGSWRSLPAACTRALYSRFAFPPRVCAARGRICYRRPTRFQSMRPVSTVLSIFLFLLDPCSDRWLTPPFDPVLGLEVAGSSDVINDVPLVICPGSFPSCCSGPGVP